MSSDERDGGALAAGYAEMNSGMEQAYSELILIPPDSVQTAANRFRHAYYVRIQFHLALIDHVRETERHLTESQVLGLDYERLVADMDERHTPSSTFPLSRDVPSWEVLNDIQSALFDAMREDLEA